jgi:hypothetical protein
MPVATSWTADQVLALAPDAGAIKESKALANPRKWVTLGQAEQAIWGECQGSAKLPYQTEIDLSEPAFKCSCPSRKLPCKHSVGLFLLLTGQPTAFVEMAAPAWVTDWLASRAKRASQQRAKREEGTPAVVDTAAQAKRVAERQAKVSAGMQELELWLRDVARQGLASVQNKPYSFWDGPALRMEDAQAKGLARLVRDLANVATAANWQERLLEQLSQIYLLIEGYKRLESLPAPTQADIRTLVGWSQEREELLATATPENTQRDVWLVLGQTLETEDKLRTQRSWLWGQASKRPALILNFAAPGQPLDTSLIIGSSFEAELVFYPSAVPFRAVIKERLAAPIPFAPETLGVERGYADLPSAIQAYAVALGRNPWLDLFPMLLTNVIPLHASQPDTTNQYWWLRDNAGHKLAISVRFQNVWQLLALSGGQPLLVFGEYDGDYFMPLGAWDMYGAKFSSF